MSIKDKHKITAERDGEGFISIHIPEALLIFAIEGNPEVQLKVTDEDEFLNWIASRVAEEVGYNADTGLSSLHRLLDEAALEAVENAAGVESYG